MAAIDEVLLDPVLRWAAERVEGRYNTCHEPDSGRFCSTGGGGGAGGGGAATGATYDRTLSQLHEEAQNRIRTATEALVEKYPATKNTVTVETKSLGILGPAAYTTERGVITMNRDWARDPESFQAEYDKRVAEGFHPPAKDVYQAVITHEFGHRLDDMTGRRARRDAEHELGFAWSDYERTASEEMSYDSFGNWVRDNLSGYTVDHWGQLNPAEAVAEAFQDVEINGAKASPAAKRLHRSLVHEYDNAPHPFW